MTGEGGARHGAGASSALLIQQRLSAAPHQIRRKPLSALGAREHPRHCHTQSLQGPGLRGSWCTSQTLYLSTSVLQERAGKILSLSSPISGYNSDVQQTVHYLPSVLGEQRSSRDGWGVEQHCSGFYAMRSCQGTPSTWHLRPISTQPYLCTLWTSSKETEGPQKWWFPTSPSENATAP